MVLGRGMRQDVVRFEAVVPLGPSKFNVVNNGAVQRPPVIISFSPLLFIALPLSLYKVISNRFRKKLNIAKMLWRLKKHRREWVSRDIRSMSDYLAFEREIFTQISHLFAHVPTYILLSFPSQSVPVCLCLSIPNFSSFQFHFQQRV